MIESYSPAVKYREPLLLFHQEGGKLHNVSAASRTRLRQIVRRARPGRRRLQQRWSGRRSDRHQRRRARAAEESFGPQNHWLGLKLEGVNCNRDAIGAKIRWSAGGVVRSRLKNNGGSYLSSHDPREVLGIGAAEKIDWVEITWPKPSGKLQRVVNPPIDRYLTVKEELGAIWMEKSVWRGQYSPTPCPARTTPAEGLTPAPARARAKASETFPEDSLDGANFLKLPPNLYLGEGIGVATNSKGHIFVYTRSQATRLFELRFQGRLPARNRRRPVWLRLAHAVRVDPQDNIWAVDEGSNMVIKFRSRRPSSYGARQKAGTTVTPPTAPEPYHFDRPPTSPGTQREIIFVSDGYGNSRVIEVQRERRFIATVGQQGRRARPGEPPAHHRHRCQGQRLRRRPQQQPHPGLDNDLTLQGRLRPRSAPWAVSSRRGRISISTAPTRIRTATIRSSPR